jgi:hypothetical protein
MISRLAYGPVALGLEIPAANVQMAGGQTWLGSVPLELPGDVNRNCCGEEGPRGGRLGEDMSEGAERKQAKATQRNVYRSERRAKALRRAAGPQRFCTQYEECMVLRPIGREVPPRREGIRYAGWSVVVDEADFACDVATFVR